MPNNQLQGAYGLLYNTQYKRLHTYLELYTLPSIVQAHPETSHAAENIRGKIESLQIITDTMHDNANDEDLDLNSVKLDRHCLETVRFPDSRHSVIYFNSYAATFTEVLCSIQLLIAQYE